MPMTTYRPAKTSLANLPTALQPLNRVSQILGGPRIWLKRDDLTGSALSGNKVRKLEYVVAEALSNGADTLITCGGLQSNHCRATALVAAQLGLKAHLILRGQQEGSAADGNLLLDDLAGAQISQYSVADYSKNLTSLFTHWQNHYAQQGRKAWCIPTGASDEIGIWGYIDAYAELAAQLAEQDISPDLVVCATGSGGTQAGLSLGAHLLAGKAKVVGMAVCDSEAYFERKAKQDITLWQQKYGQAACVSAQQATQVQINTIDKYIGPGYAKAYPELLECIRWLAATEGVVLDPIYTGKAFYGLVQEIKSGRWANMKDIVFVHTGGIFGLFPYRDEF